MRRNSGWLLILALAATAAGCSKAKPILAPGQAPFTGGSASFATYVAMGTSISAGTQSGGLVVTHQQRAFPVLFARQIGQNTFTIPSISANGIPALLRITGATPLGGVVISNAGRTQGLPTNIAQVAAYNNMGVPGAVAAQVLLDTTSYAANPMFGIIVRHRGTVLSQAMSLLPTFVSFEYGANEVLGPATSGSGNALFSPLAFAGIYSTTLNQIQAARPTAKLALFTVPDVTTIPYVTTFKPLTLDANGSPAPLIGPGGTPLSPSDFVLLNAGDSLAIGTGFPVGTASYLTGALGNGRPLLDSQVLSASEAASIRATIAAYNDSIASQAVGRGAALVDLHGILADIATNGYRFQGQILTSAFVTGGLFSLDGVHPTDIAHGILANLMIDAVNAQFGSNIAHVDLNTLATASSSAATPARAEGAAMPMIENAPDVYAHMFPWR